ncbi:hypothetical protein GCM10011515_23280 [Tsuneonella deserti]|uniref:Uncharacterized protein n=1 Tax=Tsuneonella deserti TaxID=2035528 RepID=A0ABQ1SC73_9SPHN|nr:hypothetical protein GCM10011515_23280 [Tsuneonella deserti]
MVVRRNGKNVRVTMRRLAAEQLALKMAEGDLAAIKLARNMDLYFAPPAEDDDTMIEFTLKLEDDDPRPHWQVIQNGCVVDQG